MVDSIQLPDSRIAKEVLGYAKAELNEQTFNHSMRVYYYGSSTTYPTPSIEYDGVQPPTS